jgi:basic membrane protein A
MIANKTLSLLVGLLLVFSATALSARGGAETTTTAVAQTRVVLYLNGTLGDKSFFDSAHRGIQRAVQELGIQARTIEGGYDPARWEPDIEQLAQGEWDIIIAGTWQLQEALERIAPRYPQKRFFTYDTTVDYTKGNLGNVYSILYSQNEGSFLVGALAALITGSNLPQANPQKTIGFLGGMDIPVINDFKVGYEQGARTIDPSVQVLVSYAGSFSDPAKGKELVLAQYDQGADIAFNVAGETGLGLLDAAEEKQRYAIGVDSDQYLLVKDGDPQKASYIVTSMLKNVDNSLYRGIQMHLDGTLMYGQAEVLGIREGGIGVADNDNFRRLVPQEFRNRIRELEQKILSGEIKVDTAMGK